MIKQKEQFYRFIFLLTDVLITLVSFGVSLSIRAVLPRFVELPLLGRMPELASLESFIIILPAITLAWLFFLFIFETHDFRIPVRVTAIRYGKAVCLGGSSLVFLAFAGQLYFFPRSLIVLFLVVNFVALVAGRVLGLRLAKSVMRRNADGHRVLIVGTGEQGLDVRQAIDVNDTWGFRVVGFLVESEDETINEVDGIPVLGHLGAIGDILSNHVIDTVIIAGKTLEGDIIDNAVGICDERGVRVSIALFPLHHISPNMSLDYVEGIPMLTLARTPTNEVAMATKRLIDVLVSAAALVILSPVLLLTVIAIKLNSRGPVLYSAVRLGQMGRTFKLLKFRSMSVGAEEQLEELQAQNEMSGPMFKIKLDPRVTKVGRFIRKASIDELPQLYNVLRGQMSLVGPRPSLPGETDQFEPWQRRRLSMKPGITCIWQVSGRNSVSFSRWMEMDLQYIDSWSLWLDFKILAKTIPAVVFGGGAS